MKAVQDAQVAAANHVEVVREEERVENESYIEKNCAKAFLHDFIDEIKANRGIKGIATGFAGLDEILYGGFYAGLYIMGAGSSIGKTTFALQIADTVAKSGTDVLIFSLEMARTELTAKSLSRLTYILDSNNALNTRQILNGAFSEAQRNNVNAALKAYLKSAGHLFITEGLGDIGPAKIRGAVERHIKATGNKPLVIIDYLQILAPHNERATDKQNTDKAVLELKRISRDFDVPVLAVSSFNRDGYGKTANMTSFKESGAIEYSSDVLIGLQIAGVGGQSKDNVEEFINTEKGREIRNIELKILKNRNGVTGSTTRFKYNPKYNFFSQSDGEDDKPSDWPALKAK